MRISCREVEFGGLKWITRPWHMSGCGFVGSWVRRREGGVEEGTLNASVHGSHLAEMRKAAQRRGATIAIVCGETYTRTLMYFIM